MPDYRSLVALALLLLTSACSAGTTPPQTAAAPPPPPVATDPQTTQPAKPPQTPQAPPVVLARVGEETITVEEFRIEMGRRGGRTPGQFSTVEQRQALLDEL